MSSPWLEPYLIGPSRSDMPSVVTIWWAISVARLMSFDAPPEKSPNVSISATRPPSSPAIRSLSSSRYTLNLS